PHSRSGDECCALVGTIAAGISRADDVWSIAFLAIAVVTGLQIGYLIGIWLRSFIVGARVARASLPPTPTSEAARPPPTDVAEPPPRDDRISRPRRPRAANSSSLA